MDEIERSSPNNLTPEAPRSLTVTAVVCTRNRTDQLSRALRSLLGQSLLPGEILVIDNFPTDDSTRRLVAGDFPDLRYVHEPRPGLDIARNRALLETRGDIIAFIDDDAVADCHWCESLVGAFSRFPRAAVCTGRVEALTLETEGQRMFEVNGGFSRGKTRIRLSSRDRQRRGRVPVPLIASAVSVGNGTSWALDRNVAVQLGGFDEALDCGPPLPGGGDLDMLWRVLAAGHELIYEPDAVAFHEHRRSLDEAFDQICGHQRGLIAFLVKTVGGTHGITHVSVMSFLAWRLLKPGVRFLRRFVGRDPLPAAVLLRMWGSCWKGIRSYDRTLRCYIEPSRVFRRLFCVSQAASARLSSCS